MGKLVKVRAKQVGISSGAIHAAGSVFDVDEDAIAPWMAKIDLPKEEEFKEEESKEEESKEEESKEEESKEEESSGNIGVKLSNPQDLSLPSLNLGGLTKEKLKDLCIEKGIKGIEKKKKSELLILLEGGV